MMPTQDVPKLVLIDPQNEAFVAESSLAPRLSGLHGKRVGLLDNSKSKAGKMLDAVAAILHAQYGFTDIVRRRKPSASKPADPEVINELARTCDLVVAGVGD
jgi:hypothetical protein